MISHSVGLLTSPGNRTHGETIRALHRTTNGLVLSVTALSKVCLSYRSALFDVDLTCVLCRCKQAVFVDKSEYDEAKIIVCPIPRCTHAWCKTCNLTVEDPGPAHSCDGSNEFNHLMKKQGWKYCPGCRTPAEKIDGCNHMTVSLDFSSFSVS